MPVEETVDEPETTTRMAIRILLVDDYVDTREMYAVLLRDKGHVVHQATDGLDALAVLRDTELDATVVDISLPRMNGYELARQIRANPLHSRLMLIAVTGHGLPEHRALSRSVGFDVHLVKPVAPAELLAVLGTAAPRARTS